MWRTQRAEQGIRQCVLFQSSPYSLKHSEYRIKWDKILTGSQSHYVIIYTFIFRKHNTSRSLSASYSLSHILLVLWTVLSRPKQVNIAPFNDPDQALDYKIPYLFLWTRLPAFRFPWSSTNGRWPISGHSFWKLLHWRSGYSFRMNTPPNPVGSRAIPHCGGSIAASHVAPPGRSRYDTALYI
jgi:hypothetical protein